MDGGSPYDQVTNVLDDNISELEPQSCYYIGFQLHEIFLKQNTLNYLD